MRSELAGRRLWGLLLLFVAAQVWFTLGVRHLRAAIDEMPPAPDVRALKAMALGDDEFLFRRLAGWLEFVGDGGGRVRPLRFYDYDRVVDWMEALDQLDDHRSDFVHEIAARYFGEITSAVDTGNARLRKIVAYLRIVGLSDPARNWQWLVWSAHHAEKPIKDPALIKTIAHDLQSPELRNPSVPAWVRALPIHLYHEAGDDADAHDARVRLSPEDVAEIEAMRQKLEEAIRRLHQPEGGTPQPPPH